MLIVNIYNFRATAHSKHCSAPLSAVFIELLGRLLSAGAEVVCVKAKVTAERGGHGPLSSNMFFREKCLPHKFKHKGKELHRQLFL